MKQLSKKQLYDLVKDTTITVGERNIDNMLKSLDYNATTLRFIFDYGTELTKLWCQILVDTLYSVLYEEDCVKDNAIKGDGYGTGKEIS